MKMDRTKTFVELDMALKIANKMCKPWQCATTLLSIIVAGLLFTIISSEFTSDSVLEAANITADTITTGSKVKG